MPRVQLPDGRIVEFPEGTAPAEIERSLESIPAPAGPGIGARIGQAYGALAKPITGAVGSLASPAAYAHQYRSLFRPFGTPPQPPPELGAVPKFIGETVVPQTPAEAAVYAVTGVFGPAIRAALAGVKLGGRALRPLIQAAIRTAIPSAVGTGTAAVTGEDPLSGLVKGAGAGLLGEAGSAIARRLARRTIPLTPPGLSKAAAERGPAYVDAVTDAIPVLRPFVRHYDDILTIADPKVAKDIGSALYNPLRQQLSQLPMTIDFPHILTTRVGRFSRPPLPPTMIEVLNRLTIDVLRKAGHLNPDEALTVLQQLKAIAWRQRTDSIGAEAGKLARSLEGSFLSSIPIGLRRMLLSANDQYHKLMGLQEVVGRNAEQLFKHGLNEAQWLNVLLKEYGTIPESLFPRLHNVVSQGGLTLGAGATVEKGSLPVRVWHRFGALGGLSSGHPDPSRIATYTDPSTIPSRVFPWLGVGASRTESAPTQPEPATPLPSPPLTFTHTPATESDVIEVGESGGQ